MIMGIFKNGANFTVFVLLCFSFFKSSSSAYTPVNKYFINCGSSQIATVDFRDFVGDSNANSVHLSPKPGISVQDQYPSHNLLDIYHTARVFHIRSSYEFAIKQTNGSHLLRLHFLAFASPDFNLSSAVFNVWVSGFPLLHDFSVQNQKTSLVKEFFVRVGGAEKIIISFSPSANSSLAFVNAVEVFSVPDDLIADKVRSVNPLGTLDGLLEQVLETIHRINVGGQEIIPSSDPLWRNWIPDDEFLITKSAAKQLPYYNGEINYDALLSREIAPDDVYKTAQQLDTSNDIKAQDLNLTWELPVSSGFRHLVRMHFCDIGSMAVGLFNVYIDGYSAYKKFDLSRLTSQTLATPRYIDFIVSNNSSAVLRVTIRPSDQSNDAILNGLEIMKLHGVGSFSDDGNESKKPIGFMVGLVLGVGVLICLLVVGLLLVIKWRKRRQLKPTPTDALGCLPSFGSGGSTYNRLKRADASPGSNLNLGLKVSFADIQLATKNFGNDLVIGIGGFGKVYKGVLRDKTEVAVKRGMAWSQQGILEFQTEIAVLSKMRHRHLVSLIGYCEEEEERILVYEFMENGTLQEHLYGSNFPSLSWKQRLEICIGAAKGLHYLHTGSEQGGFIHRDVKSANILLDKNYVAKVADFGISRSGPGLDQTHVSTNNIKGSFGYLDPEYYQRQRLTGKSDVYSFGVVLFEVLCARPAVDNMLPKEQVNLVQWVTNWQKTGSLEQIIDPLLVGKINSNSLRIFGETANKCLAEHGVDRPEMGNVLCKLEHALKVEETAMPGGTYEDSNMCTFESSIPTVPCAPSDNIRSENSSSTETSDGSLGIQKDQVFSQLCTNEGR